MSVKNFSTLIRLRRSGVAISLRAHPRISASGKLVISRGVQIAGGTILIAGTGSVLSIGPDTVVGDYCNLRAAGGPIKLGRGVRLAQFVSIIAANHLLDDAGIVEEQTEPSAGVSIGDGCWVGTNAVILPDVELGPHCVVGAGAVVTKSFPALSRVAGVPARLIAK